MQTPVKILFIEDNPADARLVREWLKEAGAEQFQLEQADRLDAGLKLLTEKGYDMVLLDLGLPDSQGLGALKALRAKAPAMPIVVLTGLADDEVAIKAMQEGAQDFLVKGEVKEAQLVRSLRYALERMQSEEKLRENEERFRTTLDGMIEGCQILGRDFRYLFVNEAVCRQGKKPREELLGRTMMECYPGIEKTEMFAALWRCLQERTPQRMENEFIFPDGSRGCFELSIQPAPEGLLILSEDISERKQAEEARRRNNEALAAANEELRISEEELASQLEELQQSQDALRENERKFQDTVKYLDEGYYSVTTDGRLLDHNLAFNRMLGFDVARDLKGAQLPDFWQNPDDRKEYLSELMARGFIRNYPINAKKTGGEKIVVMAGAHLVKDEKGQVMRIDGTFTDFTERKKAEEALRQSEEKYRALSEFTWDWIYLLDNDNRFVYCSPSCERITGYPAEDFVNDTSLLLRIVHPEDRALVAEHLKAYYLSPDHGEAEFRLICRNGEVKWIDHVCRAVVTEDGRYLGRRSGNRDITESKRAEEEIRKLNIELEQRVRERTAQLETANKELEAFSYSVSHDLRAPLRAIDGFSAALVEDFGKALDSGAQDYLRRIRSGVRRMAELIEALLTLSRVSRAEMARERVDLSAQARDIAGKFGKAQPGRNVEWRIQEGLVAEGDPQLLGAALGNLLDNAWKFTSKTERAVIEFGTMAQPDGQAAFFVRDNGAGFNMAYADKLFVAFQRLHSVEEFPGTGIGLVTVQRIVHRHGGRVWGEGETGRGATFYFTL